MLNDACNLSISAAMNAASRCENTFSATPWPPGYATMKPYLSATPFQPVTSCWNDGHDAAPCRLMTNGNGLLPS